MRWAPHSEAAHACIHPTRTLRIIQTGSGDHIQTVLLCDGPAPITSRFVFHRAKRDRERLLGMARSSAFGTHATIGWGMKHVAWHGTGNAVYQIQYPFV
jgi:hypothetical protein